jgi:RimJ/RimL family protein N-acetyltransferase
VSETTQVPTHLEGESSEAARLVSRWAIESLGLQRVEIFISDHNVASRMAARKSGAQFEGVLRNKIRPDDRAHDAHIFSFVPSDFACHEAAKLEAAFDV